MIARGISEDNITVRRIDNSDDLETAWSEWAALPVVYEIHLFSHGGTGGPIMAGSGGADYLLTAEQLTYGSFMYKGTYNGKSATIITSPYVVIYGCKTANGTWAQRFADSQQVGVYAQNHNGAFSTDPDTYKAIKHADTALNVFMRSFDGWAELTELLGKKQD